LDAACASELLMNSMFCAEAATLKQAYNEMRNVQEQILCSTALITIADGTLLPVELCTFMWIWC